MPTKGARPGEHDLAGRPRGLRDIPAGRVTPGEPAFGRRGVRSPTQRRRVRALPLAHARLAARSKLLRSRPPPRMKKSLSPGGSRPSSSSRAARLASPRTARGRPDRDGQGRSRTWSTGAAVAPLTVWSTRRSAAGARRWRSSAPRGARGRRRRAAGRCPRPADGCQMLCPDAPRGEACDRPSRAGRRSADGPSCRLPESGRTLAKEPRPRAHGSGWSMGTGPTSTASPPTARVRAGLVGVWPECPDPTEERRSWSRRPCSRLSAQRATSRRPTKRHVAVIQTAAVSV